MRRRIGVFSEVGHPNAEFGHFCGVSNFLAYWMRYCRGRGIEIDLHAYARRNRVDQDGPVRMYGWRPHLPVRVYPTIVQDLAHMLPSRRIARVVRDRRYSSVNVIAPGTMGLQGMIAARRHSLPVVAMYTTSLAAYSGERTKRALGWLGAGSRPVVEATERLAWGLMRRFYSGRNGVTAVLAPTSRVAGEVRAKLAAPVQVLGRGVDTELFTPPLRWKGGTPPTGRALILYAGRIHRGEKNLDRFIEVLREVPKAGLLVVGDGPHRDSLQRDLGARAEFTGALSGRALAAAYRRADFFVFPSKHDTFGQVVMEAMATGLPAVVTDQGGPQELVEDGVTGFVADDRSFVARVRELATNSRLRLRMGRQARLAAEARSWERIFAELMDYCLRTADRRSGATCIPRAPSPRSSLVWTGSAPSGIL